MASFSSVARLHKALPTQGDLLLLSGSWGLVVLRKFPPKGLKEELFFDSMSSKALKRLFLTAPSGAPAV